VRNGVRRRAAAHGAASGHESPFRTTNAKGPIPRAFSFRDKASNESLTGPAARVVR